MSIFQIRTTIDHRKFPELHSEVGNVFVRGFFAHIGAHVV